MTRFPEHVDFDYVADFLRDDRTVSPVADRRQGLMKERGW
jgi:hypothetical protein